MMSGKFTPEQDERLIDLVRLNPLLYSIKKRGHKDTQIRSSIWQLIASNIGKTEKECKIRWKIMRDYYQRRKREANKTDCMITFGGKLSNLTFLDSILSRKRNASSTPAQQRLEASPATVSQSAAVNQSILTNKSTPVSQSTSISKPASKSQSAAATPPTVVTQRIFIKTRPVVEPRQDTLTPKEEQPSPQYSNTENLAQSSNRSERKRTKSISLKKKMYREIIESRNERLEILRRLSQQPDELLNNDPNSLFFQSIKATIDRFPIHLQSQAKLKILQIVSDLELQNVQEASLTEYSNYPTASVSQPFFSDDSTSHLHTEDLQISSDVTQNFNKLNGSPK